MDGMKMYAPMLNTRKQDILRWIVRTHVKTSGAVSSGQLASRFDVSGATLRNEMAALESQGYILQPHTSAGRIPTEKGYRFFVEHFLEERALSSAEKHMLQEQVYSSGTTQKFRLAIRVLANMTDETAFLIESDTVCLAGLAHIFTKPEFQSGNLLQMLGSSLDEITERMLPLVEGDIQGLRIFIGTENPLSQVCTLMVVQHPQDGESVLFGLLGPMRMDYSRNYSLLQYVHSLLEDEEVE